MNKYKQLINKVYNSKALTRTLTIAILVQVILGVIWFACNLFEYTPDYNSDLWMKAANLGIIDDHMGIFYPTLIRLGMNLEAMGFIPAPSFVYLIQFICSGLCIFFMMTAICRMKSIKHCLLLSVFLLTIPFYLQTIRSIDTASWFACIVFILVGAYLFCNRNRRIISLISSLLITILCIIFASVLSTDIFYFTVCLVTILLLFSILGIFRSKMKWVPKIMFTVLGTLVLVFVVLLSQNFMRSTQKEGYYNRIQHSIGATLVSRFVWPGFDTKYYFWPEEIKEIISLEDSYSFTGYPETVTTQFGPLVEQKVGKDQANSLYIAMAKSSFLIDKKTSISSFLSDFIAYEIGPITPILLLNYQFSNSVTAYNYENLMGDTHGYSVFYLYYSYFLFIISMIFMLILCPRGTVFPKGMWLSFVSILILLGFGATLLTNGAYDYCMVIPITVFWYLISVLGLIIKERGNV